MLHPQNIECATRGLVAALEEAGDEVHVQPVLPGDNLSYYDRCVVEVSSCSVWGARYTLGALWTLYQRPDALVLYSHWDIKGVWASYRRGGQRELDLPIKYAGKGHSSTRQLARVAELLGDDGGHWHSVAPIFEWGDPALLTLKTDLTPINYTFDPSAFTPGPLPEYTYNGRSNKWFIATAESHRTWIKRQELKWDVEYRGLKKHGRQWATLPEVMALYGATRATLAPPYYHAGSGWWRARYVHAAAMGCITVSGEADAQQMSSCFAVTPHEVEEMDGNELSVLAAAQMQQFFAPDEEETVERVKEIVS
jgi:hypothetical protein